MLFSEGQDALLDLARWQANCDPTHYENIRIAQYIHTAAEYLRTLRGVVEEELARDIWAAHYKNASPRFAFWMQHHTAVECTFWWQRNIDLPPVPPGPWEEALRAKDTAMVAMRSERAFCGQISRLGNYHKPAIAQAQELPLNWQHTPVARQLQPVRSTMMGHGGPGSDMAASTSKGVHFSGQYVQQDGPTDLQLQKFARVRDAVKASQNYSLTAGILRVTIVGATGLVCKHQDEDGCVITNPFAVVIVGTSMQATQVALRTPDPVWNQEFSFAVHDVLRQALVVQIHDWDRFSSGSDVGRISIPLLPLASAEGRQLDGSVSINSVYELTSGINIGDPTVGHQPNLGRVHVSLLLDPDPSMCVHPILSAGVAYVTVHQVTDIRSRGRQVQQPFVSLSVGQQRERSQLGRLRREDGAQGGRGEDNLIHDNNTNNHVLSSLSPAATHRSVDGGCPSPPTSTLQSTIGSPRSPTSCMSQRRSEGGGRSSSRGVQSQSSKRYDYVWHESFRFPFHDALEETLVVEVTDWLKLVESRTAVSARAGGEGHHPTLISSGAAVSKMFGEESSKVGDADALVEREQFFSGWKDKNYHLVPDEQEGQAADDKRKAHLAALSNMGQIAVHLMDVVRHNDRKADGSMTLNRFFALQDTVFGGNIQLSIDVRPVPPVNPVIALGKGRLYVTVEKASNLLSADMNGFSDPYCVVKVGHNVKKTKTIMKTLDPVFNERFLFHVRDASTEVLEVEMFDYDKLTADDKLGRFSLPVYDIAHDNNRTDLGATRVCCQFSVFNFLVVSFHVSVAMLFIRVSCHHVILHSYS